MRPALAILFKELRSEFRTRHAISALLLFVVAAVVLAIFAAGGRPLDEKFGAGIMWLIFFFAAMTSLGRSFVSEVERGTDLLLRISAPSGGVYFGKLIFNILLLAALDIFGAALFLFLGDLPGVAAPVIFWASIALGSIGLAGAMTLISAIISRAGHKNAMLPVLAFPIVFPLLLVSVEATSYGFASASENSINALAQVAAYCGIVIAASWLLFDIVWEE
ncbi:MAG: heme exporter protein CcmB [Candidatus Kapaibacterium sp.]